MKTFFDVFISYFKQHAMNTIAVIITATVFLIVFSLYNLPLEAVLYASALTLMLLSIIEIVRFRSYYKKHKELIEIRNVIDYGLTELPKAKSIIESDYQHIISALSDSKAKIVSQFDKKHSDMVEYYTLWAHQIKTPIAATALILQSGNKVDKEELSEQLFKIEQYVEMVLQYLRAESISSDLVLKWHRLDDIVKQAVRKYSKLFIRKKIALNYSPPDCEALTDEKWLSFVIEQIISNAIKYTPGGEISIFMDSSKPKTLVIEDTGIGIQQEDLPRVFENGFTGYNGHNDKKSTGIGLYLCKKILTKLSHTIEIESVVGVGTRVSIGLETLDLRVE